MPGAPYRVPRGRTLLTKLSTTMPRCEWCNKPSDQLTPLSDWEEHGSFAPRIYDICPECVEKHQHGFDAASADWAAYIEPRYVQNGR